jgi:hypothetical protein
MRVTLSGLLCVEVLIRRSIFDDIAAEKRKGRIAGVVSSSKLYCRRRHIPGGAG